LNICAYCVARIQRIIEKALHFVKWLNSILVMF